VDKKRTKALLLLVSARAQVQKVIVVVVSAVLFDGLI
jgi:hypothetical protein